MVCDILIRSYWKDFEWLDFCLASIAKYCRGFRAVVVVVPQSSKLWLRRHPLPPIAQIKFSRNYADDYLGQQATKLLGDTFTDAEYICHVDSDCVFCRPTSPEDLITDGKPHILKCPCDLLSRRRPWRRPTEKFLGWKVSDDFMQQPPFVFPRWIYPEVRNHAIRAHGLDLETYVTSQVPRGFSEFNVLGAFAWERYHERIIWIDTSVSPAGEPHCRWYWSWGGISEVIRTEILQNLQSSLDDQLLCPPR
jgi:hypothetical protein